MSVAITVKLATIAGTIGLIVIKLLRQLAALVICGCRGNIAVGKLVEIQVNHETRVYGPANDPLIELVHAQIGIALARRRDVLGALRVFVRAERQQISIGCGIILDPLFGRDKIAIIGIVWVVWIDWRPDAPGEIIV